MDKNIAANGKDFFENVAGLIKQARSFVSRTADLTMCATYYEIGRMIVVKEQDGESRAEYGRKLIEGLSEYLGEQFGKGFSVANLKNARQFYLVYSNLLSQGSVVDSKKQKSQSLISFFENEKSEPIRQSLISEFYPFRLSWTHYLILMRIENVEERRFYEIESVNQQWSVKHAS